MADASGEEQLSAVSTQDLRPLFPIASVRVPLPTGGSQPVIYLDNAASTHPPQPVLAAYVDFVQHSYSNVHRGRHWLSRRSTERFERVRHDIRRFISAHGDASTVVLLGNTSQALDLAAHVMAGVDGVTLVSEMEHHSNDLPHRRRGAVVRFGLLPDGTLDYEDLEQKLREHRVKLVAVTGASNVTGCLPDVHRIARLAHAHGARVLVDAAQLLAHAPIDVRPEDDPGHIDFLAAAGHKAYAPFGASFLYAPRGLCDRASPYVPVGGTVLWVDVDEARYRPSPERHEAGTPNIAGAIGFAAALRFLSGIGMEAVRRHEQTLTRQAIAGLSAIEGVRVLGSQDAQQRTGVVSFTVAGVPHETVAARLDSAGIAVRNGCFCAQPYLRALLRVSDSIELRRALEAGREEGLPGAARASFAVYNTQSDVDALVRTVRRIRELARAHRRLARSAVISSGRSAI